MLIVFLFGLILSASPMTAARVQGGVGPLDIVMLIAAMLSSIFCFRSSAILQTSSYQQSPTRNLYQEPVARFWIWTIPVLAASTLLNISNGNMLFSSLGRDALALMGSIVTTIAVSIAFMSRYRLALIYGFCFGAVVIAIAYAVFAVSGSIGYNDDGRFVGGSLNPNQTALHALTFAIVCYFSSKSLPVPSRVLRLILFAAIICSLIFGLATQSDAFRLAVIPILAVFALKVSENVLGSTTKGSVVIVFLVLVTLGVIEYRDPTFFTTKLQEVSGGLSTGNQDYDRIALWENGIAAWQENIFLGNGIGAWSGISGPFEGMEAHNVIIDWLSITGIFGLIIYSNLFIQVFKFNLKQNLDRYLIFFGIVIFGMFGFYFRSPVYWVVFIGIYYQEKYQNPKRIKVSI